MLDANGKVVHRGVARALNATCAGMRKSPVGAPAACTLRVHHGHIRPNPVTTRLHAHGCSTVQKPRMRSRSARDLELGHVLDIRLLRRVPRGPGRPARWIALKSPRFRDYAGIPGRVNRVKLPYYDL